MKRFYRGNIFNPLLIKEEYTRRKWKSSPEDLQPASQHCAQPTVPPPPQGGIGSLFVRGIRAVGRTISRISNPQQTFKRGTVAPSGVYDALSTRIRAPAPSATTKDNHQTVVTDNDTMKERSHTVVPNTGAMEDQSSSVVLQTVDMQNVLNTVLPCSVDKWAWAISTVLITAVGNVKPRAVVPNTGAIRDRSCIVVRNIQPMKDHLRTKLFHTDATKDRTRAPLSTTVATKNSNTDTINDQSPAVLPNTGTIKDRSSSFAPRIGFRVDQSPAVIHKTRGMSDLYRLAMEKSFLFHDVLGKGGFGMVLLASHPATSKMLAVKIIEKKNVKDPTIPIREGRLLKAVRNNPFITHLYGSFQSEDQHVFVMEYLSGGNLRNLIRCSAPLPDDIIRNLTAEILCGLEFLHSKNIVHRDLKPLNILLDDAGHAKIADFGTSIGGVSEHNKIKGRAGTIPYMAPEVLQRDPYFTMVDYFSLGLIVYEMAVGKRPFYTGQKKTEEILTAVLLKKVYYPPKMNSHLRDLIERLLHFNQENRKYLLRNIKRHPFFENIDWAKLQERPSPPEIQFGSYFNAE